MDLNCRKASHKLLAEMPGLMGSFSIWQIRHTDEIPGVLEGGAEQISCNYLKMQETQAFILQDIYVTMLENMS